MTSPARYRLLIFRVKFFLLIATIVPSGLYAHVSVGQHLRAGVIPSYDGHGWIAEAYLGLPIFDDAHAARMMAELRGPAQPCPGDCFFSDINHDGVADLRDAGNMQTAFLDMNLIRARRLIEGREPDLRFRTDWIDFPSGPIGSRLDSDFARLGDFLDDYIYALSDPSVLDAPFGSLFLRFTGYLPVRFQDEVRDRDVLELPIWVDTGTLAFDGYRTLIGEEVYAVSNVKYADSFFHWGPSVEVVGLFPIEVTYLNVYDPDGSLGNPRAGLEVYSWHGGGFPWPAGNQMVHEEFGPGTILPPRMIYQEEDLVPVVKGDFDADNDIDLADFKWYQVCSDPNFFFLPFGCDWLDMNNDQRLRDEDYALFRQEIRGPGVPLNGTAGP